MLNPARKPSRALKMESGSQSRGVTCPVSGVSRGGGSSETMEWGGREKDHDNVSIREGEKKNAGGRGVKGIQMRCEIISGSSRGLEITDKVGWGRWWRHLPWRDKCCGDWRRSRKHEPRKRGGKGKSTATIFGFSSSYQAKKDWNTSTNREWIRFYCLTWLLTSEFFTTQHVFLESLSSSSSRLVVELSRLLPHEPGVLLLDGVVDQVAEHQGWKEGAKTSISCLEKSSTKLGPGKFNLARK